MSASSSSSSLHVDAKPWLISTAYELRESDQAKTEHKQKLSQRLGVEKRADYLKKVSWIAHLQHEAHELLMSGDYYDNQFTPEEEECVSEILAERCLPQVDVDLLVKESQLKDFRIDPNFPAPVTKHSSNDVVVLRTQPLKDTNTLTLQKWFEWLCAQKDNGTTNQIDNLDYKKDLSTSYSNMSSAPTSRTICIGTIKKQSKKTELNDINNIALEALKAVGIDYREKQRVPGEIGAVSPYMCHSTKSSVFAPRHVGRMRSLHTTQRLRRPSASLCNAPSQSTNSNHPDNNTNSNYNTIIINNTIHNHNNNNNNNNSVNQDVKFRRCS